MCLKPTKDQLAGSAADLYRTGRSIRDLAQIYCVSYGTIRKLLLEHGVELRSRGGQKLRIDEESR